MRSQMAKQVLLITVLVLSVGLAMACSQRQIAATPEEFYRGKTVTWIVSSEAGSISDLLARLIVPYLDKEIGATVKVENMASDEGVNWTYNEAPRDGLTFVLKSTGALTANDILKAPGVQYQVDRLNYISDVNQTARILLLSPKSPHKTLEALRQAKGLKAGGTSAKGAIAIASAVVSEVLGLDAKVITGYKSTKDLSLAISRGEIDFYVSSDSSAKLAADEGFSINLLTPNKNRSTSLPNVPTIYDLGVKVPQELEAPLEFILASGQAVAMPPEVPKERIEYLRKAFAKVGADDVLQTEYEKLTGARIPFVPGQEVQDMVTKMKADKDLAGRLDDIFNKRSAVQ